MSATTHTTHTTHGLWRDVRVEQIEYPDGHVRASVYVRLAGNSLAVAMDCDPTQSDEELREYLETAKEIRSDPTVWLQDPAFSVQYDPDFHGRPVRIDWSRLVAMLRGLKDVRYQGRYVTLEASRKRLSICVHENSTGLKEVGAVAAWASLNAAQAQLQMNEIENSGSWYISLPMAAVLGTWDMMRLTNHGREWMRCAIVSPPYSEGLVHAWLWSEDRRFRCLLSGDGDARNRKQQPRTLDTGTPGSTKHADSISRRIST